MAHSNSFDAIRYYLAFIVVFAHFSILTGADNFRWFNTSGEAVSGFFILSGFVVYQSYMRNADTLLFCRKRLNISVQASCTDTLQQIYVSLIFLVLNFQEYLSISPYIRSTVRFGHSRWNCFSTLQYLWYIICRRSLVKRKR